MPTGLSRSSATALKKLPSREGAAGVCVTAVERHGQLNLMRGLSSV